MGLPWPHLVGSREAGRPWPRPHPPSDCSGGCCVTAPHPRTGRKAPGRRLRRQQPASWEQGLVPAAAQHEGKGRGRLRGGAGPWAPGMGPQGCIQLGSSDPRPLQCACVVLGTVAVLPPALFTSFLLPAALRRDPGVSTPTDQRRLHTSFLSSRCCAAELGGGAGPWGAGLATGTLTPGRLGRAGQGTHPAPTDVGGERPLVLRPPVSTGSAPTSPPSPPRWARHTPARTLGPSPEKG